MIKLLSNSLKPLSMFQLGGASVFRLSDNPAPPSEREEELFIVRDTNKIIPGGFSGYLFMEQPTKSVPENSFLLDPELSYLEEGDVVKLVPERNTLRVLYRKRSPHNFILVTERCNNLCLMCSQPPKVHDDSYIIRDVLKAIPLMSPDTASIGITGGEPTLLGENLIDIIKCLKDRLPSAAVHILSNGRAFKDWGFAKAIAKADHFDLMIGIPIYSDISSIHDYVVQADGAFDETIRGVINLKSVGVRVELRVVIHKITYERLPDLARFIRRNLTFADHVALMGLEITGFSKFNLEKLWIDPKDYQTQLKQAVNLLSTARIPVSIYNHQLCVLDPEISGFNRKSISDWKNEFLVECSDCVRKHECGGFFSTSRLRRSAHIKPFVN